MCKRPATIMKKTILPHLRQQYICYVINVSHCLQITRQTALLPPLQEPTSGLGPSGLASRYLIPVNFFSGSRCIFRVSVSAMTARQQIELQSRTIAWRPVIPVALLFGPKGQRSRSKSVLAHTRSAYRISATLAARVIRTGDETEVGAKSTRSCYCCCCWRWTAWRQSDV